MKNILVSQNNVGNPGIGKFYKNASKDSALFTYATDLSWTSKIEPNLEYKLKDLPRYMRKNRQCCCEIVVQRFHFPLQRAWKRRNAISEKSYRFLLFVAGINLLFAKYFIVKFVSVVSGGIRDFEKRFGLGVENFFRIDVLLD